MSSESQRFLPFANEGDLTLLLVLSGIFVQVDFLDFTSDIGIMGEFTLVSCLVSYSSLTSMLAYPFHNVRS